MYEKPIRTRWLEIRILSSCVSETKAGRLTRRLAALICLSRETEQLLGVHVIERSPCVFSMKSALLLSLLRNFALLPLLGDHILSPRRKMVYLFIESVFTLSFIHRKKKKSCPVIKRRRWRFAFLDREINFSLPPDVSPQDESHLDWWMPRNQDSGYTFCMNLFRKDRASLWRDWSFKGKCQLLRYSDLLETDTIVYHIATDLMNGIKMTPFIFKNKNETFFFYLHSLHSRLLVCCSSLIRNAKIIFWNKHLVMFVC